MSAHPTAQIESLHDPGGARAAPASSPIDVQAIEEPDPTPRVELETVYAVGARQLPEGDVVASQHDTEIGAWNIGGSREPGSITRRATFHPAVRVIVETKVLSGKGSLGQLTAGSVLAQARNQGYWPFRLCYEEGLRSGATKPGRAILRFSFDTRGKVTYARRISSNLETTVSDCLRKASYGLRFRPAPPRRVDVELSVRVAPGDVALPARDTKAPEPEWLPAARQALAARSNEVARCYAAGLARDPDLWGRIALRLDYDASRKLMDVTEWESQFADPDVTRCVSLSLRDGDDWVGAPSKGSVIVAWRLGNYPTHAADDAR